MNAEKQRLFRRTYLSHICDHAESNIREGFVEITAHHADPGKRVPCVRACLIQSHHMS